MVKTYKITINDIINRDVFQSATILAGHNGLENHVKWTHIMETSQLGSIINGGELILTTGAELKLDTPDGVLFLNNLISIGAAGICIELGTHIDFVSNEVISFANEHQFPIIIFDHFVKFIDITQDLHTLILHNHHHLLQILNELSMSFSELALLPNGILKILEKLFSYSKGIAIYITNEQKSSYFPPESKVFKKNIHKSIMKHESNSDNRYSFSLDDSNFVYVPVKGAGITWGYLCLQLKDNSLQNMIFPVLEQAALAIAQIMLRNRTKEERKQNAEDKLVRNLLYGKKINTNELREYIPFLDKDFSYRLILIQNNIKNPTNKQSNQNDILLQKSILLRFILKENGLTPAISIGNNEIAIIAFFKKNNVSAAETDYFLKVIRTIKNTNEENVFEGHNCLIGVSSQNESLSLIAKCYQEAQKVMFLKKSNISASIFYNKIGIYRLLLNQPQEMLHSYVNDYLQPLIDYDTGRNSELLKTLEVYLECHNAKKEAADRLYIVRQTLYHRLQKIKELLGEDFLEHDNRIALEMAIKANYVLPFFEQD